MKRTLVLFDIDHTLFDASLYRQLMFDLIEKCIAIEKGESLREKLAEVYISHRKKIRYFDLEFMLRELQLEINTEIDIAAIFDKILKDETSYTQAIYEDTVEVLQELAKNNDVTIGIFSNGRHEHQLQKIKSFAHLIDKEHIHIFRMKEKELEKLSAKYKDYKLFIVDDILEILYNAKKVDNAINTVWIRRDGVLDQKTDTFTPDYTVRNLREIIPVVREKREA